MSDLGTPLENGLAFVLSLFFLHLEFLLLLIFVVILVVVDQLLFHLASCIEAGAHA